MKNILIFILMIWTALSYGQTPNPINITDGQPDKGTGLLYFNDAADMSGFAPSVYDSELAKTHDTQDFWNWNGTAWESLVPTTSADTHANDFFIKSGIVDSLCVQLNTGIDLCTAASDIATMLEDSNHLNTSQTKTVSGDITHNVTSGKLIYELQNDAVFEIRKGGITLFSIGD